MTLKSEPTFDTAPTAPDDDQLDSWKEIAAYLRRDITTVRRWEKREGLPVHRHLHERRDSVYGFRSEIDAWWRGRRLDLTNGDPANGATPASAALFAMRWREALAWSLAGVCLAAVLLLTWRAGSARVVHATGPRLQYSLAMPDGTTMTSLSLSPDGSQLAFTTVPLSGPGPGSRLWLQRLNEPHARAIPDTDRARLPFWSARGDALGFFADGQLWTIAVPDGPPRAIAKAPDGRGGAWNADDIIVFAPSREGPLYQVAASGGSPKPVTTVDSPAERGHLWPTFLPDGRRFLYLADSSQPEHHHLFAGSLDGSLRTLVLPRGMSNAAYGAGGRLVFARDRQLVAQSFDAESLMLTGEPSVLVEFVHSPQGGDHLHDFSVASSDLLVYRRRQSSATRLIWRDRHGRSSPLVSTPDEYYCPMISPDGARVAVGRFELQPSRRFGYGLADIRGDVLLVDAATGRRTSFVSDPSSDWGPVWSPDGRHIVFSSNRRNRVLELYQLPTVGISDADRVLSVEAGNPVAQSWSPDGRFMLYAAFDPKTHMDLWLLPMQGGGPPQPLLGAGFNEMQGQISPAGGWLAYSSDESGRIEVYVDSFPALGAKRRISTDGGGDPRWSHDGRELYYIAADRRLMSVAVSTAGGFKAAAPIALFDTGMPPQWYDARNLYDVSRDGRFLFMEPIEDDRSMPLTLLVNWLAR